LRFLGEDPWERLEQLRAAAPGVLTQMLIRGRNALGYAPYPDRVVTAFVAHARATGMDVFRVFDSLNDVERTRPVIDAVREHSGYAEGAICYTGDLLDPAESTYTLDYYLRVAEAYVAAGVHGLVIKDMAGLLRPSTARVLVEAIRDRFDVPLRLHTHDTAGGQMATLLAAIDAGVDGVDAASAPLASGGSQPSLGGLLAATQRTTRNPNFHGGLDVEDALALEPYWSAVRDLYAPFDAGQRSPSTAVYAHEIPGGQLSNLKAQAAALGITDMDRVLAAYADANRLLGRPIKVTPSSKVVGDLAIWMVAAGITGEDLLAHPQGQDLPASAIAFLQGQLGIPEAGFRQPFTEQVLTGRTRYADPVLDQAQIDALADAGTRRTALTRLMLPAEAAAYEHLRATHGHVAVIPTRPFLFGLEPGHVETLTLAPGQQVFVELDAIGDLDDTGRRSVHLRANGQPIAFRVIDNSAPTTAVTRPKAEPGNPAHIGATVPGVIHLQAAVGDRIQPGQRVAVIEAMKMEAPITSTSAGIITALSVPTGTQVEPGDLIATLNLTDAPA
jgi:pyruvate carboxylase